jgi:hypothetical protein
VYALAARSLFPPCRGLLLFEVLLLLLLMMMIGPR